MSPLDVWRGFSLDRRFATLALALAFASTLAIGGWVTRKIEDGILSRSSGIASVYISDLLSPLVQDLATTGEISGEGFDKLDSLLLTGALRLRIVAIKIWSEDGTIIYSSDREMVGKQFVPGESLVSAFSGEIASEIDAPSDESAVEFKAGSAIFEVYAPIYDEQTGDVLAVAEFYEDAADLARLVAEAKSDSWMVTCFVLACNVLAFFTVVHGGSKTIDLQRSELRQRVDELSQAMSREKTLRDHVERGAQEVFNENERFLRALGSDLHDGPAQLIASRFSNSIVTGARSTKRPCCRRGPPWPGRCGTCATSPPVCSCRTSAVRRSRTASRRPCETMRRRRARRSISPVRSSLSTARNG